MNIMSFADWPHFRVTMILQRRRFYYCDCQFLQHYMPIDFLVYNERNRDKGKGNKSLSFVAHLNRLFRVYLFLRVYFSVRVVGLVRLVTGTTVRVWWLCFNSLYFHELSARSPRQIITIIQSNINTQTSPLGKCGRSEKTKRYLHFLFQTISLATCLSPILNHPVYVFYIDQENINVDLNNYYR
jgi:hypothetical protein